METSAIQEAAENLPPIAPGTCPSCDHILSRHGCSMFRCYGPPAPKERDRRRAAAVIAYDQRWREYVGQHGRILWRAAGLKHRSHRLSRVLKTFLDIGYLSPGETRLLYAITHDLDRNTRRQEA